MANGDNDVIGGLLGSPTFTTGLGLLSAALGNPRSFGEGLFGGISAGQQLRGMNLRNEARRARLEELNRQRQMGGAVQDLIDNLGPQGAFSNALQGVAAAGGQPGPTRQAAALGEQLSANAPLNQTQAQALGLLAQSDPSAALESILGGGLLGPAPQPEFRSPIGKLLSDRAIAAEQGNQQAVEALDAAIQQEVGGDVDLGDLRNLRSDVLANSQTFIGERQAFQRVEAAASSPSAAGDLAMIFNFMKLLDPGSTVREGEFATAQNAEGVPGRIRNLWNRLLRGERLNPEQRQDFLSQARNQYQQAVERQRRIIEDARGFAERQGFAVEDAIPEFVIPRDRPAVDVGQPVEVGSRVDLGNGVVGEFIE